MRSTPECTGHSFSSECQGRDRTPHECGLPRRHGGKHACRDCGIRFVIGDGQDLRFVRHARTGIVHILRPSEDVLAEGCPVRSGGGLFDVMTSGAKTLCGQQGILDDSGRLQPLSIFEDRDTCGRCIRTLGIDAPLAFEHARPSQRLEVA